MKKQFISDFDLACEQQGISNELPDVSKFRPNMQAKVLAEHKLGIMADANNAIAIENGDAEKDIDPTDDEQYKWLPVYRRIPDNTVPRGFRLAFHRTACGLGFTYLGCRPTFVTKGLADFMAAHCLELYEDLNS